MFIKHFGCFVLGIGLFNLAVAENKLSGRIVGGLETTIDKIPSLVQIWINGMFMCGGTMLTNRFVASAAHCFQNTYPKDVIVKGGASKLADVGIQRKVDRICLPAGYGVTPMHMDVAILKLTQIMSGSNTGKTDLYTGPLNTDSLVQVAGWGFTTESGSVSNQVRTVSVPINDKTECAKQYASYVSLSDTMFCASEPGSKDSCSGDSGGPVFCNGKLCGIVSFGIGCAQRGFPGVYTSTTAVKVNSFIQKCLKL